MGIFSRKSEQEKKLSKLDDHVHLAKTAYDDGQTYFEYSIMLQSVTGIPGVSSNYKNHQNIGRLLSDISEVGWELVDTGYNFTFTHLNTSGFESARVSKVNGYTQAHYTFKRYDHN